MDKNLVYGCDIYMEQIEMSFTFYTLRSNNTAQCLNRSEDSI